MMKPSISNTSDVDAISDVVHVATLEHLAYKATMWFAAYGVIVVEAHFSSKDKMVARSIMAQHHLKLIVGGHSASYNIWWQIYPIIATRFLDHW